MTVRGLRSYRRRGLSAALLASSALLSATPSLAQNLIIDGGTITTVPPSLALTGYLRVGDTGNGTLEIGATGEVSNTIGYIGNGASGIGVVTVSGSGAQWNNSGNLYVGNAGQGTLEISGGGIVSDVAGYIANAAGSAGAVTVSGSGSQWNNSDVLNVGNVSRGTLEITAGGIVSSAGGYIGRNANGTGTVTVSGSGSRWNNGSSVLYVGSIGNGTLDITAGGAVSNAAGYIGNSTGSTGTVLIDGAGSQWTSSGGLFVGNQGEGSLTVQNGGSVISNGSQIGAGSSTPGTTPVGTAVVTGAGSSWDLSGGALRVGQFAGATGSLTIADGGVVSNTSDAAIGNAGIGSVVVTGSGSLLQVNNNINVGYLSAGAVGALTVSNGGMVSAGTYINVGGQPGLVGTVGTLNIGAAATDPAAAPGVVDTPSIVLGTAGGSIVFNHTDTSGNYQFTPVISGAGEVDVYSGTTVLTAASSYSGATTIYGGTLDVEGSIASSAMTTVNAGATLSGTGAVGNATIAAGGIFAPGNGTPGTAMTVSGNLAMSAGAQYVVNINPATSSLANVSGTATLGGATVNAIYANGSYVDKRYTILTAAGGVDGTFSGPVNTNLPAGFQTGLSYDATNAYLDLTLRFVPPGGVNGNQQNVANALTGFFDRTGSIPLVFGTLTPTGLTQVSGELATGTQQATFDAMTQFMGVMTDASGTRRDFAVCGDVGATSYTKVPRAADCLASRWNVWAAGYGGGRTTDSNAVVGSSTAAASVYGVAVGADYRISPDTLAGFALAGGGTNFGLANGLGSGRSDLFQAGAFIRQNIGAAYLTGALAYGWQDITTNRTLTIAGIDQLRTNFNANAFSGRLEGGYRFDTPWMGLTPYAAGQFTTFDLPGYGEQALVGSDIFALSYAGKTATESRSELGLRTDNSFALADGVLTLRGRLAWAHNFDATPSIVPTFQALPGASFVVSGASIGANSALTTVSAEMTWHNGWSLAATFDGEFSDVSSSYAGRGVLRYRW